MCRPGPVPAGCRLPLRAAGPTRVRLRLAETDASGQLATLQVDVAKPTMRYPIPGKPCMRFLCCSGRLACFCLSFQALPLDCCS